MIFNYLLLYSLFNIPILFNVNHIFCAKMTRPPTNKYSRTGPTTPLWFLTGGYSMEISLPPITQEVSSKHVHNATIIFLHGIGGDRDVWARVFGYFNHPYIKGIFPSANIYNVTVFPEKIVRAWYDKLPRPFEDIIGIEIATKYVHNLIEAEIKNGTPSERIMLAGFEQGGELAINAALTFSKKLAGILAVSTSMVNSDIMKKSNVTANMDIPILHCHGLMDRVVPFNLAEKSVKELKKFSKNVEFKTYPDIGHELSEEEIKDFKIFLKKHLP